MSRVVVSLFLCAAAAAPLSVSADEHVTAAAKYSYWSGPSYKIGEGIESHGVVAGVMVSANVPLCPIALVWCGKGAWRQESLPLPVDLQDTARL
jgi:hypothetical protein